MKNRIGAVLPYLILSVNHLESLAWKSPTKLRPIFSTLKASSSVVRSISSDVKYDKVLYFRGGSEEEDSANDSSDFDEDEDEEYNSSSLNKEEDEEDMNATNDDTGEEIKSSLSSSAPIKVTLKTAVVNNPLIDISIEITASPKRTVQSLKQSVSRQFKARPPMDSIQLRLDGKFLDDDTLLEDLIVDDDEEEDDHGDEDDDDGVHKLTILVDMIPPVDPKFGTEIKARLDDITNEQLLEAYVVNLAAMHQNSMEVMAQQMKDEIDNELLQEENDENENLRLQEVEEHSSDITTAPINLTLQKYANNIKSQVISFLSEDQKKLLEKKDTPSSPDKLDPGSYSTGDVLLKESIKRKRRGGARMNMKRVIQKNLNINWPDTIRNFLLFLFFGYFGGRNAMSRTIMLLGAPACFIIQARPVKIGMKQIFYTIGEPPGILLSLLPAPQQTIMSCDYNTSLKSIYGEEVLNCNEIVADNLEEYSQPSDSMYVESDYDISDEDDYDSDY